MSRPEADVAAAGRPLRILHLPTDTGGHSGQLSLAERELGADSSTVVFRRSDFGYAVDVDLRLGGRTKVGRLLGRAALLARTLPRIDVVHGNFGQAFLPSLGGLGPDLALLRAAGRGVFMTFQGCDARQRHWCRDHRAISCCGDVPAGDTQAQVCRLGDDPAKRATIRAAIRWCHGVFCVNPDLLEVVPGATFIPYASVDPRAIELAADPVDDGAAGRPLRIAHCPTNRDVKGTEDVLGLPARLAARGIACELDLVERVDRAETLRRMAAADLVIDQLRIGWYGGLATEAMSLGRPVIARLETADRERLPAAMNAELPVIDADAASLDDVVAALAGDPAERRRRRLAGRRFVERWHDPRAIAAAMLACYRERTGAFWRHFQPVDRPAIGRTVAPPRPATPVTAR
jgi:hypothetical protein